MNQYLEAKEAFDQGEFETSSEILNELLKNDSMNPEALLLRSSLAQKKGDWSSALNDLNKILEVDDSNEKALIYKKMIMDILKYRNTDLYNP